MKRAMWIAIVRSVALVLSACGGDQVKPGGDGEPGWVAKPGDLCGVGNFKIRSTVGNATKFAMGKARDELSRKIETKVGNMIKSYLSEGGTADGDFSEEKATDVSRQISKTTLNGSAREARHLSQDGKIREVYVLVCLKPGALTKALNSMNELSAAARKALTVRADKADSELKEALKNY